MTTADYFYSVEKQQKIVNTNKEEVKRVIGMQMLMGIVKLPSYFDYWDTTLRYSPVSDVMAQNKFSQLRQSLHFVDNTDCDKNNKTHRSYEKRIRES